MESALRAGLGSKHRIQQTRDRRQQLAAAT
jgi:hypothetical protein